MIAKSLFNRCWWQIGGCVALVGTLSIGISKGVMAQIVPDATLGAEGSIVTPNVDINGIPSDQIDGGATRGTNLFHSFAQFNIDAGRGAYFTNPAGIENILSRVTGANRSEILGRLGVLGLGTANLFLINPNGIVFGPDASLDVQGSFLATTANAVKLGDTGLFSASQPATSNLLSISPSALWFDAVAAQPIVNQSQAPSPINQPNAAGLDPGLQVPDGRTLALVGGDVLLEGGNLTAAGGRIELGSVAGVGQVILTPSGNGFVLGYDSINEFGNIGLANGAFVDTSGAGGGGIQIRGERLEMTQSSNILANTLEAENGGEVLVRTTEVVLSESSLLRANVTDTGTGTGGNLTIDTGSLLVQGGAQLSASTFGEGNGGSLQITASDSVEVIGTSANDNTLSALGAQSQGSGDAGNLTINTRRLLVRDGALISSGTFGSGKGGSLQITAAESIELIGATADGQFSSGLFTQSEGSGDAGNLTINTQRLLVQDGAAVSASATGSGKGGSLQITAAESIELIGIGTFAIGTSAVGLFASGLFTQSQGGGDAGNLSIDTRRLLVRDGAQVSAGATGSGNGGSLLITAADSVELIGTSAVGQVSSGLFTQSPRGSGGDAGDLTIHTGRLLVQNGAGISSRSVGEGTAGNISITARDILQADNGTITANTSRSDGGAITIKAGDVRLFGDSDIISSVASGANNGGNIDLEAGSILAFDDSDIVAFARDGRGGNITLDTPAFFGENYRPAPPNTDPATLDNNNQVDINATGTLASGTIILPDTTFIQNSLSELPENQIDTDSLLANSCIVRRNQPTQGSFTITGAGGLPQRPGDTQMSRFPTVDMEALPSDSTSSTINPNRPWQKGDPIVEPQGVYRLPNGKLVMSRECSRSQ